MQRILIVHNAPIVRNSLRRQLPARYDVLEAATPAEALDVCRDHGEVDLLVCDVDLEPVSGMELAALLRGWNANLQTILIADLAYERWTERQRREFRELPAETKVVILQKPFDALRLQSAIKELKPVGSRRADFRTTFDTASGLQGAD